MGVYLHEEKDECRRRSLIGPREAVLEELEEVDTVLADEPGSGGCGRVSTGSGSPGVEGSASPRPGGVLSQDCSGEMLVGMVVAALTSCLRAPAPQTWIPPNPTKEPGRL